MSEQPNRGDPEASESEIELTLPSSSDDDDEEEERNAFHGNGAVVGNAADTDDVAAGNAREAQAVRGDRVESVEVQQQQQPQQEAQTPRSLRNRDSLRPPTRYTLYCVE